MAVVLKLAMSSYSERLGEISNQQFQLALDKFELGKLEKAKPVKFGNFGQNVFLTTNKGEFVFRGKPHYSWQFKNEQLMTKLLHEKTKTPVAYPYFVDEDTSTFGWSYAIMPRLKGLQLADEKISATLTDQDSKELVQAYGENLALMHDLTWEYSGKWTDNYDGIKPFAPNFSSWVIEFINSLVAKSIKANQATTESDKAWVESVIKSGSEALEVPFTPTFVMQDYQESNTLVDKVNGKWQVTGVFDLMESYFGNGEADLSRMYVQLQSRKIKYGSKFIQAYLNKKPARDGFKKRFPIYVVADRLLVWEWAQRTGNIWWEKELSFRDWCEGYTQLEV